MTVVRRVEHVMGTAVSLLVHADAEIDSAIDDAVAWLHEVDDRFTTYRPGSDWLRYRAGELAPADLHPDVRHVVERAEELTRVTQGAFRIDADPNRPADPAAYVKGWAVQRAADILVGAGASAVCVNGGGDVALWRLHGAWRVGIQDPFDANLVRGVVEVDCGAVATSGSYERGDHVFDPRTGAPARGLASVTVVGPDLGTADAYATAAFALGRDAPDLLRALDGYGAFIIDATGATETIGLQTAA
ncbi:MAG: FAD:protein FMN transferase [Acidimicrobiia bacterium]|nr:FAD:protein FMN transferase [Acidimicrobiia bacterium]